MNTILSSQRRLHRSREIILAEGESTKRGRPSTWMFRLPGTMSWMRLTGTHTSKTKARTALAAMIGDVPRGTDFRRGN